MADTDHTVMRYRATVAGGRLLLHDWHTALAHEGPLGNLFRDRTAAGVVIADVEIDHSSDRNEAVVGFLTRGPHEQADRVLIDWARRAGHRRIWLEDLVVDFGDEPLPAGPVAGACTSCAMRWEERGPGFWETVRESGRFPTFCPLCGGTLAQWDAEPVCADE